MPPDGRRDLEAPRAPERRPSVEVWLGTVSPSIPKPSPEEHRQWDLSDRGNIFGRSFLFTTTVLRAISLITALAAVVICMTIIAPWGFSRRDLLPTLIACFTTAAWDAAEFTVMYVRGGQGLPWRSHIVVDGAIAVGVAIAAGFSFAKLPWLLKMYREYDLDEDGEVARGEVACLALSILLILTHIGLVIFILLAHVRGHAKKQKNGPRIVYLPTADPIVVTQEPAIAPATTAPSPISPTPPGGPGTAESIRTPVRQGVPPRRPVAGAPTGTHYASPWPGPDYQPDEAERARAARGELQAQWMTVQAKGLRQEKAMENVLGRRAEGGSSSAGRQGHDGIMDRRLINLLGITR